MFVSKSYQRVGRKFSSKLPPPLFEYEAPKDDSKTFDSTAQFVKRYLILFPVAIYCSYKMCFVRRNKFSNQKELKLFARPFESFILGAFISSKIKKSYQGLIYKKDTEEVSRVLTIIDKLSKANHLQSFLDRMSVVVLHNTNTIALYTSLDSTLFVTV
jgi:hypothetical protein